MACGKPVIALRKGGALETVVENETGVFFDSIDQGSLSRAIQDLEKIPWNPAIIRRHAEQFSEEQFLARMEAVLRGQ